MEKSVGGYGHAKEVVDLLKEVVDKVDNKHGCAYGSTALFWGLVAEINRHTDKTTVKRG